MMVHLHVHSPYSFLDGGSDLETLVQRAATLGMPALALTDHDNVCAAVKFVTLCAAYSVVPILGAELTMEDGTHLTLLAQSRQGYANLCGLITVGYTHGGRLTPKLPWPAIGVQDIISSSTHEPGCPLGATNHQPPASAARLYGPSCPKHPPPALPVDGLFCLSGCRRGRIATLVRARRFEEAAAVAARLRDVFGRDNFYVELQDDLTPHSFRVCLQLAEMAEHLGVGAVATNNVHYATPDDFVTHDILRCVAAKTTREEPHPDRPLNAERYLKSAREMQERFDWRPEAVANTLRIAERCEPALPARVDITPKYDLPAGQADAPGYLRHLVYKGGKSRYRGLDERTTERIEHELQVICDLGYADYFLMAWSVVRWARKEGILVTGRGSAADSCVAYCLMLTDVDVIWRNLPFARFLAEGKVPDIDLDFPSDRRDDVFHHIVQKYGEAHVGMVCVFHTYWGKGAIRDIGKTLALPAEALSWLSDNVSGFVNADKLDEAFGRYAELRPHGAMKERFQLLFQLCARIAGFPRHIGTHSSGIVISRVPLASIAPLQPSARGITQIWELDKDDAEEIGAIKLDVLSLRMLSAAVDAEADIRRSEPSFRYGRIPLEDPETFQMIRAGKAIGAFQLESAAQLSLAATLQPEHFEDLVASVALIRPGPIQGHVVQRFTACRNGWARVDILHPSLAPILAKTYGCVVFQEQVVQIVAVLTGCSEREADLFRKSITQHTKRGTMEKLHEEFLRKAWACHPDLSGEKLEILWDQIRGWAGFGFAEGHAASFALTASRTAYLVRHHPAAFFSGEMNHQPMGFYGSNTLAGEARRRGVQVFPVDINRSGDKCCAEDPEAIRLGLRLVNDLREADIEAIVAEQAKEGFRSLLDFCARVVVPRPVVENLILCGAFDSLHEHRRGLLWRLDETLGLAHSYRAERSEAGQESLALGTASTLATPIAWDIDDFSPWDKYMWSWRLVGVTAESHVFAWLRERLALRGVMTAYEALRQKHGALVTVAGLNIRPHRPRTVSGNPVLFTQIEDETEMIQAVALGEVIWQTTSTFLTSPAVVVRGTIERRGRGVMLKLEQAKLLRMQDYCSPGDDLHVAPPTTRTYPGTKLAVPAASDYAGVR
jgi:error-prone DNA polymerase